LMDNENRRRDNYMKKEDTMEVKYFLSWLWLSVLLSACAASRGAQDVVQGKEALLARLPIRPRLFSASRTGRPEPYMWYRVKGRSLELFGQSPVSHGKLSASAPDFAKSAFPAPNRQPCTAIPRPYVLSSRGSKGGTDQYLSRHE
jgi:hypothetical protein